MSSRNHYDVLEVAPTAAADEIKRAFRAQIARYHPDKVQHLGKEFQEMAAGRAADLTEAYRVLSNELQRAEYNRSLVAMPHAATMSPGSPGSPGSPVPPTAAAGQSSAPPPSAAAPPEPSLSGQYAKERASRDQFVRKATFNRIRQALALVASDYDEVEVRGFDIALAPKKKLFGSGNRPRVLGQFMDLVDAAAVADAWALAAKLIAASPKDEICVLLLGSSLAPARELADAIAMQRRRNRTAKLTLIPIDVRTWDAHIPVDSPGVCKDLLTRLKGGN